MHCTKRARARPRENVVVEMLDAIACEAEKACGFFNTAKLLAVRARSVGGMAYPRTRQNKHFKSSYLLFLKYYRSRFLLCAYEAT